MVINKDTILHGRVMRKTGYVIAGLMMFFLVVTMYNYFTLSGRRVFRENFSLYEIATVRDYTWVPTIEKAYKEEDFRMVTALADTSDNVKNIFLSSIAYLQLDDPVEAIKGFQRIFQSNKVTGYPSFKEDAEYYLALAYILNEQYDESLQLLKRIKDEPAHPYHSKVSGKLCRNVKRLNSH